MDNEILDTAINYFIQAYEIAERSGDEINLSIALTNLGETALSMGLYTQSEQYQKRAYEISYKLGDKGMMATINQRLDLDTIEMLALEYDSNIREKEEVGEEARDTEDDS